MWDGGAASVPVPTVGYAGTCEDLPRLPWRPAPSAPRARSSRLRLVPSRHTCRPLTLVFRLRLFLFLPTIPRAPKGGLLSRPLFVASCHTLNVRGGIPEQQTTLSSQARPRPVDHEAAE